MPAGALSLLTLLLATVLALSACGGSDDAATPGNGDAAGTRTFVDVRGEPIEVPADPQRIVAIHDGNGGVQVLELGHELVGFPTRGGEFSVDGPEGAFDIGDAAPVGETYEPNIEAIAALDPDLIVGEGYAGAGMDANMGEGVEERLREIAPTVYIDVFRPVDEVMADFGELLGPEAAARAEELQGEYTAALEGYQEQLANVEGLSAVFVQHKPDASVNLNGATATPATTILTTLGVPQPPITAAADEGDNGGFLSGISVERIPELSADVILSEHAQGHEFSGDHTDSTLWLQLPAVQADQVVPADDTWYSTSFASYLHVLEQVGPALVAADPSLVQAEWETADPDAETGS